MVFLTSLLVIVEQSYGIGIGLIAPLSWIILPVTIILTIQWMASIHWVIIDALIMLMCVLAIIEKSFGVNIGFISPIAWIVFVIMIILMGKDLLFMKIKR
jgi:hypothetical protein